MHLPGCGKEEKQGKAFSAETRSSLRKDSRSLEFGVMIGGEKK
jgi:hypothetical protein